MLFGYIFEVVKDATMAEQQLISFYTTTIKDHLHDLNSDDSNIWCQLQRLLKKHLTTSDKPIERDVMISHSGNKFLEMMTNDQKFVFYYVYYHGKSTKELSYMLDKPEEQVCRCLKEAFKVLRQET